MQAYEKLALVYDELMEDTPYQEWVDTYQKLFCDYQIEDCLLLDLACGTGIMTRMMSDRGYDMIGIDLSNEMMLIGLEKEMNEPKGILYSCQDMREFELYGTVKGVYCACDSFNYLTSFEELEQSFRCVNNYLDPGGLLLFDFNTDYKYEYSIGECVIAENREHCSFIWENYYEQETKLNEYELTLFLENEEGLFERHYENHVQRGYSLEEMKKVIEKSGLHFEFAMDLDTKEAPTNQSERILVAARECQKQNQKFV